jgi:predicted DNA-binding transcriptional regulator AlpA
MRATAELAGISIATLYRVIASGDGPRTVRMSPRRRGITDHDLADWLEARAR